MLYLIIVIVGGILSYFGHWWMVIPVALFSCFFLAKSRKEAFLVSSAAVTSLWVAYASYLQFTSEVDLMQRIVGLFTAGSSFLQKIPATGFVISVMTLIAGLIGGWGGLSGYAAKELGMPEIK